MALLGSSMHQEDDERRSGSLTPSYNASSSSDKRPRSASSRGSRPQSRIDGDPETDDEDDLADTLSFGADSLHRGDEDDDVERGHGEPSSATARHRMQVLFWDCITWLSSFHNSS